MSQANPLARLESAHRMLAEARTVDEVKEVRDKAEVARLYARERDLGLESQNWAAEIKIRAERKLGELLPEAIEHGGDRRSETRSQHTTLKDLGIDKSESHRFQQIAKIPEPEFEQHIAVAKAEERELTFVVAPRHITKGSRGHPMRCPVFLALTEMGYPVAWVNAMTVGFNGAARYRVPPDLSNWIRNYDNNQPVYPERFRLTRSEMSAGHGAAV